MDLRFPRFEYGGRPSARGCGGDTAGPVRRALHPGHGHGSVHFPDDDAIAALLEARIAEDVSNGIVLGVMEPDGSTRIVARGDAGTGRDLSRESVFEIGSITKAFTGILLADMVRRGEVSLDDPVSRYLPDDVQVPSRNRLEITLAHLSSQVSGLPRQPTNGMPANPSNPYVDYGATQLYAFLSTCWPARAHCARTWTTCSHSRQRHSAAVAACTRRFGWQWRRASNRRSDVGRSRLAPPHHGE